MSIDSFDRNHLFASGLINEESLQRSDACMARVEYSWLVGLFLLIYLTETAKSLRRLARQVDDGEFLIYRFISESKWFCLAASQQQLHTETVFTLQLRSSCSFGVVEARWVRLEGNLFQNAKFSTCLTAALTLDGFISGSLVLKPCDNENRYQKFACDSECNVALWGPSGKTTHALDHEEVVRDNVPVAIPLLRLGVGKHISAQWIVYDQTLTDESSRCRPICSVPAFTENKQFKITTTFGGRVVGKPCVFPFIHRGSDVWQCFRKGIKYVCATVRNLDRNPNQWGVCPLSKRGTFSDWLSPAMCDKACGGGRVYKPRKCLFPPCRGTFVGIQPESCNVRQCSGDHILTVGGDSSQYAIDALPLVNQGPIGVCKFPFVVDGQASEVCRSDHKRKRNWCSLTDNFDRHEKWGYCLSETKGLWTSWLPPEKASCSTSCGGGYVMQTRICHQPPCSGKSRLPGKKCNTQECPQCVDGIGRFYRGEKNVANDGTSCQFWNSEFPHAHPLESPSRYAELEENYCRNPRNRASLPYCYRNVKGSPAAMLCDLVPCGVDIDKPGVPYTIPTRFSDKNPVALPCVFPFSFHRVWYDVCIAYDGQSRGREQCAVNDIDGGRINPRYCPSYVRGKWSDWLHDGDCTKSCGSGFQISFRRCLLSPCLGSAIRVDDTKLCNTHACSWSQPGVKDCFTGRGVMYDGTTNKGLGGQTCKLWSSVPRHSTALYNEMLPEGMPRLVDNHCRNPLPGTYRGPWCFVLSQDFIKWSYCDIPKCPTKEGEVFGLAFLSRLHHNNHSCIFPFLGADNKIHDKCASVDLFDATRSLRYCGYGLPSNYKSLIINPIEPHRYTYKSHAKKVQALEKIRKALHSGYEGGRYGICPHSTRGTWSSWAENTKCSVECGGGFIVRIRSCLHPPCANAKHIYSAEKKACNDHKCPTCLTGNGKLYRGTVQADYLGNRCMEWSDVNSDLTQFHPGKYAELQGNYCRNPGGYYSIPWCYRQSKVKDEFVRIFCDVPHCSDNSVLLRTIPFTIPDGENHHEYNHSGKPCIFPYLLRGDWYHTCLILHSDSKVHVCRVKEGNSIERNAFAICPPHYRGQWTAWMYNNTCSRSCGAGRKLFLRECLFPPCKGSKFKFEGSCNTHLCKFVQRWKEDVQCFTGEGISYFGKSTHTVTNTPCYNWGAKNLYHSYFSLGVDLLNSFCRNPSPLGKRSGPWCYTSVSRTSMKWEYCDVPKCPAYEGEIITLGGPGGGRPCHFPFWSNGQPQETCISGTVDYRMDGQLIDHKRVHFCATADSSEEQGPSRSDSWDWGICPYSYQGTLSAWALVRDDSVCSRKCGGGQLRYRRKCRFDMCKEGISYVKLFGACNTQPCDDDCIVGKGIGFRGRISFQGSQKCRKWSSVDYTSYQLGSNLINSDHNYCRNLEPSQYDLPFCILSSTTVATCDIPHCEDKSNNIATSGPFTRGQKCHFPFYRNGKLTERCFKIGNSVEKYCGLDRGTRDVVSEKIYGKCSKYKVGTWSDWKPGARCNRPCGGGQLFQSRICRYSPCEGKSQRYIDTCNNFPCDKTSNCYDARTKGIEFRGSAREYTKGRSCVLLQNSACSVPTQIISRLARPACVVDLNASPPLFKFCRVRHCPDSVEGPIMVQPKVDELDRPFSPCIFPFKYQGRMFHKCVAKSEVAPPTDDENRHIETSFWCSTIEDVRYAANEWGYCMDVDRGKWGNWFKDSSRCTAVCLLFEKRHCLFSPCHGEDWRLWYERCNHPFCSKYSWGKWSRWSECDKCIRIKTRRRNCVDAQRLSRKTGLATLKFCQGFSTEMKPCSESSLEQNYCSHMFVYGQTDPSEVLDMTQKYSRRKYLGKRRNSAVSLLPLNIVAYICFCIAHFFN